jgi:hypothetical protein
MHSLKYARQGLKAVSNLFVQKCQGKNSERQSVTIRKVSKPSRKLDWINAEFCKILGYDIAYIYP